LDLRVDKENSKEIINCVSKISSFIIDNNSQFGACINHKNKDKYRIEITSDQCTFDDYILFYGSYVGLSEDVILSIWQAVDEKDKGGIENALAHIYNNLMLPKYDSNISDLSDVTKISRGEITNEFVNIKDEYKL